MTAPSWFLSPSRGPIVRAAAMLVAAIGLLWRTETGWALGLAVVMGILLVVALVWPAGYAPVSRSLDRLQRRTVRAFSWFILGVVFAAIFVPGRVIIWLLGRARLRRRQKRDTYWDPYQPTPAVESFDRQF